MLKDITQASARAALAVAAAAAIAGATVAVIHAQAKRPMAISDLLTAIRVSDPQLSPDGSQVAFVRTTTDVAKNARDADIWIVPASGSGQPRALVAGPKSDSTPRWSPDGKHLAFISSRGGTPQVFVADASGMNVRQISHVSGGAQPPLVFSPDGTLVAFVSDVHPECKDDACNKQKFDAAANSPVQVHELTHLLYRHWDEWREGIRHHLFVAPVAGGTARDLTPGDYDSPPDQDEDNNVSFSPDSRTVAFVSNHEGADAEAWTTNKDVWLVPVAGGDAKKLTPNKAADDQPVFTPDGRSVIVRAQRRPGFESDRWYFDVYDRSTGAKRTVFESPDLSPTDFVLSRDGRTIFFVATQNGGDNLYGVPLAGGAPQEVVRGGGVAGLSAGASTIVYGLSTMRAPAEIFARPVGAAEKTASVPLTHMNGWLSTIAMNAPESFTVAGAGGASVQYWVIKPPNFDASKKYPVVFLIHGGPQGDWGDAWSYRWNPELWAAQGWVIVAPNPRGSTGFGQKYVDEISQDWGGKAMVDLTSVFDAAVKLPYVDATRQAIAGASYGGYAVDWIIGHTTRFKAAVSHDGVFNLESMALATEELWFPEWEMGGSPLSAAARANFAKWSPHLSAQNIRTPTLVITNEQDFRVPVDQGLQLFTSLRLDGVPSKALVFPDEGHFVLKPQNSQKWHQEVFGWIRKYL